MHFRSTAVGADAFTTTSNQVVLGTAAETYTLPGISSALSEARQVGQLGLVTSDAGGNLSYDPDLYDQIGQNEDDIQRNKEGIALALALQAPYVPPSQTFAVTGAYGNFEGASALAFGGAFRLNPNIQFDAGLGVSLDNTEVGGRVGVTFGW